MSLAAWGAAAAVEAGDASLDVTSTEAGQLVSIAGDIACSENMSSYNEGEGTATQCRQKHTSELILGSDYVFVLGDGQYPTGSLKQYQAVYDPTWGRKKAVTFPTPGDHEYQSGSPAGYFDYFGVQPYYSFDIGSWHWISLNSEIDHGATSEQQQWLLQDLASTSQPCIGAFWSSPRFSSGAKGNNETFVPFWEALYAARADLVFAGDHHAYELREADPRWFSCGRWDSAVRGGHGRPQPPWILDRPTEQ